MRRTAAEVAFKRGGGSLGRRRFKLEEIRVRAAEDFDALKGIAAPRCWRSRRTARAYAKLREATKKAAEKGSRRLGKR